MYELMIYCLKVGACLAVFYLFFKLLLSRETFHRLNRFVIHGAMALSFVLPLCVITIERELPVLPEFPVVEIDEPAAAPTASLPEPFPWEMAAGVVFLMGAVATLGWTLWSLVAVLRVIRRGRHETLDDGAVLVTLDHPVTPFSWGRYVVLSEADYRDNGREIIIHEQAHLRMRHSVDLLLTDVAGCLQWFNPAMWLLRRELRAIHEYEADKAVLDSGTDAKQYQLMLIKKAAGRRWYSVANSFNHSKLKNRITMMLRKKSSRWAGARTLLVLPLTALALGAFARTAYVFPEDKGTKEIQTICIIETDSVTMPVPLYLVDGEPIDADQINTIDVSRIESMEVWKDSTSIARYGEKGRNGVVSITLRKPGEVAEPLSVDTLKMDDVVVVAYGKGTSPKTKTYTVTSSDNGMMQVMMTGMGSDQTVRVSRNGQRLDVAPIEGLKGTVSTVTVVGARSETMTGSSPNQTVYVTHSGNTLDAEPIEGLKGQVSKVTVVGGKFVPTSRTQDLLENSVVVIDGQVASIQSFDEINADKIESMTVLKDSASVAKYSSDKAIDGVILVSTKKKSGGITIKSTLPATSGKVVAISDKRSGTVQIRNSSDKDPLWVIDGKKVPNPDPNAIKPEDIHSMSVLKDKDAQDMYGAEAANGVILVTTKQEAGKRTGSKIPGEYKKMYDKAMSIVAKAEEMNKEVNKTTYKTQAEYDAALAKVNEEYAKSVSYLEMVQQAAPDNKQVVDLLKSICFRLRDMSPYHAEKYKALAAKLQ